MNLYEINAAILNVLEMMETYEEMTDGESQIGGAEEYLNKLEMARDEKLGNICKLIKNLEAYGDALGEEKKKLAEKQATTEKKIERLKEYLVMCLGEGTKWRNGSVGIRWRKADKVMVEETLLPDAYFRL